jgi:protein transport protein SEC23
MQVGLAEAKIAVESTGGILVMAETCDSDQFKKSLQKLFMRDEEGHLKMFFNASVEVMTTREVKVCGAIGPCSSLHKKGMLGSLHSFVQFGFGFTLVDFETDIVPWVNKMLDVE